MLGGSLSPQHGTSSSCGWRNGLQLWRLASNILNKQPRTYNKGWSSSLGLGVGLIALHHENKLVTKNLTEPLISTDSLDKQPKLRNMDMRFGTWNVRSLYRTGSLMTISWELSRYKWIFREVVGLERGSTQPLEYN
jgi:hypothetical protein